MKKLKTKFLLLGLGIALVGCALPEAEDGENGLADYFTRVLEFSQDLDGDEDTTETVITRVYDDTKKQTTEVVNTYDADGVKTQTDNYDFDNDGNKPADPSDYTVYTYFTGGSHDGDLQQADTYDSEGTRVAYYVVGYPDADDTHKETIYYVYDGSSMIPDRKVDKYYYPAGAPDPDWEGELRVEKYFTYDTDASDWNLKKEKAFWYEDNEGGDGVRISHELSHSFRGDDTPEEVFIYKPYSYTDGDKVYLESDYEYDGENANFGLDATYGSFTVDADDAVDPFEFVTGPSTGTEYNIEYDFIGEQKNMIVSEYNDRELISREAHYTGGAVQEVRTFEYDAEDRLINMSRYINEVQLLEEKVVIGYREKTLGDGQTYDLKETLTYRFSTLETEQ